jgi:hypothetical protein
MQGCGVVMREAHFIFYWGDEISWLRRLYNTRCVEKGEQGWLFLLFIVTASLRARHAFGFQDLAVYSLAILKACAYLLVFVLALLLFLLLSKIIFFHDGPS